MASSLLWSSHSYTQLHTLIWQNIVIHSGWTIPENSLLPDTTIVLLDSLSLNTPDLAIENDLPLDFVYMTLDAYSFTGPVPLAFYRGVACIISGVYGGTATDILFRISH